jgi:hypothetical protein
MTGKSAQRGVTGGPVGTPRRMTRSGEDEMHRYRIAFLSGVAVGFVIGARAGR